MASLQDVKHAFAKFFYLTNYNAIDLVMGMAVANQLSGPSVSMYIIAPSGSGKSDLVNGFEQYHHAYMASKLSANSLVSGYLEPGKKKGEGVSDKSLLVRLQAQGKNLLVLKDFTTVLEMPGEARQSLIAQFREVTDGRVTADYGHGDTVLWKGKLGILAACTSAIDQHAAANNILGERFLSFRLKGEALNDVYSMVQGSTKDLVDLQAEYARCVAEFLLPFDLESEELPVDPEVNHALKNLVGFVAHGRTAVCRDKFTKEILAMPEHEGYGRIARQMQLLGSGIALVRGDRSLNMEAYKLLKKVARDTVPQWRYSFIHVVYNNPKEYNIKELAEVTGIHYKTLYKHVSDLEDCGVLGTSIVSTPGQKGTSRKLYLTREVTEFLKESGVFIIDYIE